MKLINTYLGRLLLFFCLISASNNVFAQEKNTVSGKVFDETGQTVPGANVSLKGADQNVITDINGAYVFSNVAAGTYTISATNVGYKSFAKQITVKEGESIEENLFLETESQNLKEVVVTG